MSSGYPGDNQIHVIPNHCDFKCVAKQIAQVARDDKKIEDSYLIFDLTDILHKWNLWHKYMPNIEPHYAVKCNDHPFLLRALAGLGAGFDCASEMEMKAILEIIGEEDKDRIIFAQPCKQNSHLEYAKAHGIEKMTFDCAYELEKIKKLYPNAKPLIRIKEDDEAASSPLGAKFGACVLTEVKPLLKKAKELELDVVGVAFHVGSGAANPRIFEKAIRDSKCVFKWAKEIGLKFHILDIGGGFPAKANCKETKLFTQISKVVRCSLNKYFPPEMGVTVFAEPGRYFAGTAFAACGFIHTLKEKHMKDDHKKYMYYINDGVYGSFNNIMYDHKKPVPELLREIKEGEPKFETAIWGPTCDSLDRIYPAATVCESAANEEDEYAELELCQAGDWLLYRGMGAYTLVASENFNGFPKPELYNVCSKDAWDTFKEFLGEKTFNTQNFLRF
ncbi:ornithine decarboxylase [Folsomia candida]|nr:ornithine decarboxylase [Folsomia candida]